MTKKKILIIAVIIIAVAAFVTLNLMKKEKGTEVEVEKVEIGKIVQTVTGSGQIRPEIQVKVSANVAGKIIKLHAEEGDQVMKGQLLVELDPEQYIASLARAKSNRLSMRATEKKLKSELNRAKDLIEQGLISDADFEAAEAAYEAAVSNTQQADANVNEAKDMLAKTKLHSDMDGIVTDLNKEEGEIALGAQFQEDVIMVVADLSKMEAAIEVDENDVVNVTLNDTSDIEIDAFPDTTFRGVVTQIANSATVKGIGTQEQVTNFEVTVALIEYNEKFRPGMSTTVDIITETRNDVLKVPIQAVTTREKEKLKKKRNIEDHPEEESDLEKKGNKKKDMIEVVFVVEDNHAIAKPVKLGISDDTYYEIISGVNEGDELVTAPFRVLSRTLQTEDLIEIKEDKGEEDAD
jgi:HlyD family secretion protein